MAKYRCVFVGDAPGPREFFIDAEDEADAFLLAEERLRTTSFVSVQVWNESRQVGGVALKTPRDLSLAMDSPRGRRPKRRSRLTGQ